MRKSIDKYTRYRYFKRGIDMLVSFWALIILFAPMCVLAFAVKVSTGERAIFKQRRVGADGRLFTCYKFRTMYENAPSELSSSAFVDAEQYITPIGSFLRRTSIDELPQLYNVLRGDMSLVGPRPLIVSEREAHDMRMGSGAYSLRPGMTGLAQISGRTLLDDINKVMLDTEYTYNMSFLYDARIVFRTLFKVAVCEGTVVSEKEKKHRT